MARNPGRARYADPGYRATRTAMLSNPLAKCWYCGTEYDLTVDHIVPVSLGGGNEPSNLRIACRPCNSAKGNR